MKKGIVGAAALLLLSLLMPAPAMAKDVTLNFKNADIRAVIDFVAGFSGKRFLVDNRVKGKVTIVSPTPIPESQAYQVFLSVLEVNGFAAVPSGPVVKIIPRAESKQRALPVESGPAPNNDSLITEVLRLQYADATQLLALIRPLVSPNSQVTAYAPGNMLLVTDSASNVRRIEQIVHFLDRKDAVGVHIFHLQHASADKLATTLNSLYVGGGAANRLKALAYDPGNVLVVVASPQRINEVSDVVARLDIAPSSSNSRLQVHYLKYASAKDVATVLNKLIGHQGPASHAARQASVFSGDVNIVPDKTMNALLITADPSDMKAVEGIVDKLDVRRREVLIEALIVEVTADEAQQFGVEWRGIGDFTQPGRKAFGGTAFSTQAGTSINTVAANPFAAGNGLVVGMANGTISFGGQQYLNIGALARALETNADTNVLSTPDLLTMDNEQAEIVVGQNVPFITGQNVTQGGTANPFQTIERKDVGLTLRVTPQISEGDTVRLKLYQEISSVAGGTAAQGGYITNKRSIKTVVLANNGQIIVLGGLMQDDSSASVQRVPCIGAMPIVGEPFKFTQNQHKKTNLMVFLKPYIIKSSDDIQDLTSDKYSDIKQLYEKPIKGGTILFPQHKLHMPSDMVPKAPAAPGADREPPKAAVAPQSMAAPVPENASEDAAAASVTKTTALAMSKAAQARMHKHFDAAMQPLKSGDYEKAASTLTAFIKQYPTGAQTPAARYWLGEVRFAKMQVPQAIDALKPFESMPVDTPKRAPALFRLGASYQQQGAKDDAARAFEMLRRDYPGSIEADNAAEQLKQLGVSVPLTAAAGAPAKAPQK